MALVSRTHDIVPPACFFALANSASRDSSTCTHHAQVENRKEQTERIRFNLLSQKHLVVLLILGQSVEQPTRTNQGRVAFFQLLHLATVYTQLHMDANSSPHAPHQSPRIHGYVGQNRHLPCRPTYPKHDSCKARSDEHIGLHHERANSDQRLWKLLHAQGIGAGCLLEAYMRYSSSDSNLAPQAVNVAAVHEVRVLFRHRARVIDYLQQHR